jgi:hypothetical protein
VPKHARVHSSALNWQRYFYAERSRAGIPYCTRIAEKFRLFESTRGLRSAEHLHDEATNKWTVARWENAWK